jgi:hypothetical protein
MEFAGRRLTAYWPSTFASAAITTQPQQQLLKTTFAAEIGVEKARLMCYQHNVLSWISSSARLNTNAEVTIEATRAKSLDRYKIEK